MDCRIKIDLKQVVSAWVWPGFVCSGYDHVVGSIKDGNFLMSRVSASSVILISRSSMVGSFLSVVMKEITFSSGDDCPL